MIQMGKEKTVQLLCEGFGIVEGSNFVVTCDRVLSGWRVQQVADEPFNHLGLHPGGGFGNERVVYMKTHAAAKSKKPLWRNP